jgi:5-hydroxyisourate hydrolase
MSAITTHILDTTRGRPAVGVAVELEHDRAGAGFQAVGEGVTNADGRVTGLLNDAELHEGHYRLRFHVGPYFEAQDCEAFYPFVEIVFTVRSTTEHYHVPLLLNPFGYGTYRGS